MVNEIIRVGFHNIQLLKDFIQSNPKATIGFRYFNSREFTVINNHLLTNLYYVCGECIGYGHLDAEGDRIWLGVMVADKQIRKGYGNFIMDNLLSFPVEEIFLSVDKVNVAAFELYINKGFKIQEDRIDKYIMSFRK